MQKIIGSTILVFTLLTLASCATVPNDRYSMQKGAAIGAGLGALTGQALGHNTGSTLIGTGVGTLVGAIVGNAIDQRHQALRETPVVHPQAYSYPSRPAATTSYQHSGGAIGPCRTVTERVWEDGRLIRETSREVCDQENAYHTY